MGFVNEFPEEMAVFSSEKAAHQIKNGLDDVYCALFSHILNGLAMTRFIAP